MSRVSDRDEIAQLLEPVVAAEGLDLDEVDITPAGRRRVVRVVVDADSVSLDAVAQVSRTVSVALDAAEVLGGAPYTLEVTSPGVDRPLTLPRHWRRSAGRLVKVRLTEGGEVLGRVVGVDDTGPRLQVEGAERTLEWAAVAKAVVQVEFNRPTGGPVVEEA
jgi:ribosome maturation factor RimP